MARQTLRRPRRGQGPGISKAKYDRMFRTYLEDQNIKNVARKCRVDPRTARKYVDYGDPTRGLRPIRERYAEIIRKAQEREDMDLAKAVANNLALVREAKKVMVAKLREALAPDGETLTARASAELPADPTPSIERLVRLEQSLLGEPDLKVETTNWFAGWSNEEVIAFGAAGKLPSGGRARRST